MEKVDTLIRTKLRLPITRSVFVPRPQLKDQILRGLWGPLTLVTAPAGFGKTTLVASCAADLGIPIAWLSLEKDDNQVERFLTYLISALQTVDERIGIQAAQLLGGMQVLPPSAVLTSILNDLDQLGKTFILALDDYHSIVNPDIHAAVTFFLDHCPQTLHFLVISRSDPPLPLSRLRARGMLVELRAADLRFTPAEAGQFLNDIMGLHLSDGEVASLEERTEGWIAGLQMAALSLRDRPDTRTFIDQFSGTNRYILDYLLEEVLASQPAEIQFFLICTSILERLTASLCGEVLRAGMSEGRVKDGPPSTPQSADPFKCQSNLEYLERTNLFLAPLDTERKWYRYHHLFADLLRARLEQLYPGLAARLHAHAASWCEAKGFYEAAIHHALAAGDYAAATRLVEAVAEKAWLSGQYNHLLTWTKAIPSEWVFNRPWLCVWNAWAYSQLGILSEFDGWIAAAERAAKNQYGEILAPTALQASPDAEALLDQIATLRVFTTSYRHDYAPAIEMAEAILRKPPLKNEKVAQFTLCNLLHLLGSMYFVTGNLLKAEQACQETIDLAKVIGFTLRLIHCTNKLILVNNVYGRLHRSRQLIEDTLSLLQKQDSGVYFAALQFRFRSMELLYEWNQLDEYHHQVETLASQKLIADIPYLLVDFYNIQAVDFILLRDYQASQDALDKAKALAQQTYIWEPETWQTERIQVRLWLERGDLSLAARWASWTADHPDAILRFPAEKRALAQGRVLLALGAYQDAIYLFDRLSTSAKAEARNGSLIEIHTLKAVALLRLDRLKEAVREVKSALALAEPQGYFRTFLDEGQPMVALLSRAAKEADFPQARYAQTLLRVLRGEEKSAGSSSEAGISGQIRPPSLPNASLIEPLSPRELEILHLLAQGKTNKEIASQLIVATGTIKAHAASIYRKLDAANRTEAVDQARRIGILP